MRGNQSAVNCGVEVGDCMDGVVDVGLARDGNVSGKGLGANKEFISRLTGAEAGGPEMQRHR